MSEDQNSPYDFIMNKPPEVASSSLKSGGFKRRLLIVGGGAVVIIILIVIIFSIISGISGKDAEAMYKVQASQLDIADLTGLGISNVRDQKLLNYTTTINLVINSHLKETQAYIAKTSYGKNSTTKVAVYKDSQYKKALDDAKTNNNYDDSFRAILANRMDLYRTRLQTAYSLSTSQTLKNLLNQEYSQLETLNDGNATDE